MGAYRSLSEILRDAAQVLLPPERLTVTEAAEKYRYLYNPGSYTGPWKTDVAPYLREVMDTLASRHYRNVIYVKPAQSGGTEVTLNWMLWGILCDPADMYFYQTTETTTREFGKDKLGKMVRHCPELKERLLPGKSGQQAHALRFRNGTRLKLSWPSINEMSGHSTGRIALTDYDRMPENVDGEGSPFELAQKRTTSFGSFAMTFVESSPGREPIDANWRSIKTQPHMAAPCTGVLGLYNNGDRRRIYWPCPFCGSWFEPCFHLMWWPPEETDLIAAAEQAGITCPSCAQTFGHDYKYELNQSGQWFRERDVVKLAKGQAWIDAAAPKKAPRQWEIAVHKPDAYGDTATFWSKGPVAAFTTWRDLVLKYLRAKTQYDASGDYQALKVNFNTDWCLPYNTPGNESERNAEDLQDRAVSLPDRTVPQGVRVLLACVDVQKRRFEVQVHGISAGLDITVIDRFAITKSQRKDDDGDPLPLLPASYLEDWDLLVSEVMDRTYPLDDDSGRWMAIKATVCDSGGAASTIGRKASTTEKAYNFYRKLKGLGRHRDFHLIKGGSNKDAKRLETTYPDAERKDRHAGARGEIPVLLVNPNILKASLDGMLDRTEPGGGMIHFPDWLPPEFYEELTAEIRTPQGWKKIRARNESWDLLVYCLALLIKLKLEPMNWARPYGWAAEWDKNTLVSSPEPDPAPEKPKQPSGLAGMGADLL